MSCGKRGSSTRRRSSTKKALQIEPDNVPAMTELGLVPAHRRPVRRGHRAISKGRSPCNPKDAGLRKKPGGGPSRERRGLRRRNDKFPGISDYGTADRRSRGTWVCPKGTCPILKLGHYSTGLPTRASARRKISTQSCAEERRRGASIRFFSKENALGFGDVKAGRR